MTYQEQIVANHINEIMEGIEKKGNKISYELAAVHIAVGITMLRELGESDRVIASMITQTLIVTRK